MKRVFAVVLALILCLSLGTGALAADAPQVMLSNQHLTVDGRAISCEKYNIDGANYFKLRDLAFLLNGTGSQFSVGYDAQKRLVTIVTGESYVPDGSELVLTGKDKSATAVVSSQTIRINGTDRSDLSVWNIGGNNYFKLRDLGTALGFDVDYDAPTRTMLVSGSALPAYESGGWVCVKQTENDRSDDYFWTTETEIVLAENGAIRKEIGSSNSGTGYTQEYSYDGRGNVCGLAFDSEHGSYRRTMRWDENRNLISSLTEYEEGTWSREEHIYDDRQNEILIRETSSGDYFYEAVSSYDDGGRLKQRTVTDNRGTETTDYSYDGAGRVTGVISDSDSGASTVTTNLYTADGNLRKRVTAVEDESGISTEITTCVYDEAGREISESCVSDGELVNAMQWSYDESGMPTWTYYLWGDSWYECEYSFSESGNLLKEVDTFSDGSVYTMEAVFDEQDRCVSRSSSSTDGENYRSEYVYNAAGLLVLEKDYVGGVLNARYENTYDCYGNRLRSLQTCFEADGSVSYTYETLRTYRRLESDEDYWIWLNLTPYMVSGLY